jgi:uncharacterized protein
MPDRLPDDFVFNFEDSYEEFYLSVADEETLNALLFRADSSKGVIFYLHGNAGSLNSWANVAQTYTDIGYDIFLLDYRGYGKSSGNIYSEKQLYDDVQVAYDLVKNKYKEERIIVLGYSIGTGPASMIAANNNPGRLILQAPYYSLSDMMTQHYPFVPTFFLKYQFDIASFITQVKAAVTIFHGNNDAIIDVNSSIRLKEKFKANDELIILDSAGHNGMTFNDDYLTALNKLLSD